MEMATEGSGGTPLTQPPPSPGPAQADDEAAAAAALALTKRARKRSRYLSPPYTDTDVQEKEEEEEAPPDVSAAEVLSALRTAVLWQAQGHGQGAADAAPLRFLALYRRRTIDDNHPPGPNATAGDGESNKPPSAGGGGVMLSLNAGPAMMPTADDGSDLLAKKKKKNPQPQSFNAGLEQDAYGNIWASHQSPGFSAASAAYGVANPVALPKKTKTKTKYRKRMKESSGPHYYFRNPVALVLDFAEGILLPSKEDLVSTFRRFGFVIDSETAVAHDNRSARVAFATRAQAEAAYSCAETLGMFGPPFAAPSLQDLPPITLSTPAAPVPKLPLMDIRNNLEKMILSLTCSSSSSFKATEGAAKSSPGPEARLASGDLAAEMQRLLAKVNKKLQSASATAPHRRC